MISDTHSIPDLRNSRSRQYHTSTQLICCPRWKPNSLYVDV